jgi:sigma-E factor negative regulatory protein RseC
MEYGRVIEASGGTILVEVESCPSCEGCAAGSSCALAGSTTIRRIRMENTLDARVGDVAGFVISGRSVVAGSLLFYLLPVVMLIAGVLVGDAARGRTGLGRDLSSILGGLAGLIMSFPIIAAVSRVIKKKKGFSPRLVEVAGMKRELI